MRIDTPLQQLDTAADREGSREALLACTSGLRLGLLGTGDVVAASIASAERFRGEVEHLSLASLHHCAESLTRWLESPAGLARRHGAGFAAAALDVVGLVEQCIDAAFVEAPGAYVDTLLARLDACREAVANEVVGDDPGRGVDGTFESFADDTLDELDRCEDLLLRAELEGATREGLEALMLELAAMVDGGQELGVEGLDAEELVDSLTAVGVEPTLAAMIDRLLDCVDKIRYAVEVAGERRGGSAATASIPLPEFVKRLRRTCRDRARKLGRRIQVETDADGMARVSLAAAENFYDPLVSFAKQAVDASLAGAEGDEPPTLRIRATVDTDRVQLEIEDDAVDETVAGETIQSLDARAFAQAEAALHPYRRGYVNIVQVLID